MKNRPDQPTRRGIVLGTLTAAVSTLFPLETRVEASDASSASSTSEFTPENDYPYFDYEPRDEMFRSHEQSNSSMEPTG